MRKQSGSNGRTVIAKVCTTIERSPSAQDDVSFADHSPALPRGALLSLGVHEAADDGDHDQGLDRQAEQAAD